ncbi:unnamed protein product, partial [Prorocentrum cordatum]
MLGLWGEDPAPTPFCSTSSSQRGGAPGKPLGPNMAMPALGDGCSWPRLVRAPRSVAARRAPRPAGAPLQGPVSPVWVAVEGGEAEAPGGQPAPDRDDAGGRVEFVGRWFLEHPPELLQELVVGEARRARAGPPGGPPATAAPRGCAEVEEVDMAELVRLRRASEGDHGGGREPAAAAAALQVEEVDMADFLRLRAEAAAAE